MGNVALQRTDTLEMQAAVLDAIEEHYSIVQAARVAGVSRPTIYSWCATNPTFAQSLKDAQQVAMHNLEGSLYKRAVEKDTIAAIFLLKMMDPERYQDKLQQAHDYRPQVTIHIGVDQRSISVNATPANVAPSFTHGVNDDTQLKKDDTLRQGATSEAQPEA